MKSATARIVGLGALVAGAALWLTRRKARRDAATLGTVRSKPWGTHSPSDDRNTRSVHLVTLTNAHGLQCCVSSLGATVTSLLAPDRDGQLADVTLGFDALEQYAAGHPSMGSICGRVANRIKDGEFSLPDGSEHRLDVNAFPNTLHGGRLGFDKQVWDVAETRVTEQGPAVTLVYTSPDGEMGFPGVLHVEVTYTLTNDNELAVSMRAESNKMTICNLAQHSYWNLKGHDAGNVFDTHHLQLNADAYTPTDRDLCPTGEIKPVDDSAFDFRELGPLNQYAWALAHDHLRRDGYDHNFIINRFDGVDDGRLVHAATLAEPESGRTLEVWTDQPALQVYTANWLDGSLATTKDRADDQPPHAYGQYAAICLETQNIPDAINHVKAFKAFPSVVLRPGEQYRHELVYRFGTQ